MKKLLLSAAVCALSSGFAHAACTVTNVGVLQFY
jgi:hypothetical protein